ncbi:methyltransferase domain-containing protein [Candidatus Uhrbacteria bacterium]|nr:methyltransferase domain-containing protein [Candidatus Uhrbacteria bacterium]
MRMSLLEHLACPSCGGDFDVHVIRKNEPAGMEEIQEGALECRNCKMLFPIKNYIPRFIPDQTNELQTATIRNFGFEWQTWNAFGWGDSVPMETTRAIFDYKVLKKRGELEGKLVLDGGCGNGRYTAVASEYGGTVIGIDLSTAVDVAFENLKHDPKVHIVQGDLFHPPFKKERFDFIFSNGVLMHTGNAKRAFQSLCRFLKPDGEITIHLYHKGNFIYEAVDASLRWLILKLPLKTALAISKVMASIASWIPKGNASTLVNGFIRLEPHPHYVFDWYTAPIATHHTYPEVYRWLEEEKLFLVHDHNATAQGWKRKVIPFLFMTVKASKLPPNGLPLHTRE